jgi:hypothetical protein
MSETQRPLSVVGGTIGAMTGRTYEFDGPLWRWQARQADVWTFVSLPQDVSDEVLDLAGPFVRGFGSLRVEATVGATVWRTSIFPDAARRTYVLPVKKAVRDAEGLVVGGSVNVRLRLLVAEPRSARRTAQ